MKLKSRIAMSLISAVLIVTMLPLGGAWGAQVIPPPTFFPLNQIPVPEPPNLFQFVKNKTVAIKLGKAFFWDMQTGSDGIQACGSCHFSAGADNRITNTVNPGANAGDATFQVRGPNETLQPTDFPFHQRQAPVDFQASPVIRDTNDIVGSQGVRLTNFLSIVPGSAVDNGAAVPDPVFQVNGANMRRVTARNTPSNINAIFNFNNFWDGRAHFEFNGVNPFGTLDPFAGVWVNTTGTLFKQPVAIRFGSLASQATGPPLNETEMSYKGRTFPELGRKMLSLTPLGKQLVHPNDSELGPLSRAVLQPNGQLTGSRGLTSNYKQMIQDAFQDYLWNSQQTVSQSTVGVPSGEPFSQMEANFSLFWGLAIQLYEATLVSDQTPFDRFLGGDQTALTSQQQDGFNIFFGVGACFGCHTGTEMTAASVTSAAFISNASHALIEPMVVASGLQVIYDNGFNNTAVRPTTEDIARGDNSPFFNPVTGLLFPLSFSRLAEIQQAGALGFNSSIFGPGAPATPILPPPIPSTFPVANNGNFKVPGLRNVELTAPYMHNGGMMDLDDVVEFYTRGGNFPFLNRDNRDIIIAQIDFLQNNPTSKAALVSFLMSLTDERVRNQSAPFDRPELNIPNGDSGGADVMINLPARDQFGVPAPALTVSLTPGAAGPQLVGTPVLFTAATGSPGIQYRFWLFDGTAWNMVQDYGAASTWTLPASTPPGNYVVAVDAKALTSSTRDAVAYASYSITSGSQQATGVILTPDQPSPHVVGTAVLFTAQGQGSAGYDYRFWLYNGSSWSMVQNYGNGAVWSLPASTPPGSYTLAVDVRTSAAVDRDAVTYMGYQFTSSGATGVTISPDQPTPHPAGTAVQFTAAGQGSSGYQFQFWLFDGTSWSMVQDYPAGPGGAVWILPATTPPGTYVVAVNVRTGSAVGRDAVSYFAYQVQ